jgi:hypothetical protein
VVPGWYVLRLNWGGVEVGQTRRHLTVDFPRLNLDGPRVVATSDKRFYAPGETVQVTVQACNDADLPYREELGDQALTVSVRGNLGGSAEIGEVRVPERVLEWQPGECKSWVFTWDQRYGDGTAAVQHEAVTIGGAWNQSGERWQNVERQDVYIS